MTAATRLVMDVGRLGLTIRLISLLRHPVLKLQNLRFDCIMTLLGMSIVTLGIVTMLILTLWVLPMFVLMTICGLRCSVLLIVGGRLLGVRIPSTFREDFVWSGPMNIG